MSENDKDDEQTVVTETESTPAAETTPASKSIDSLKKLSPKTLIAIGIGVLVLGWLVFAPSGDQGKLNIVDTQKGQSHIIENPNGRTVKLTKAPGVSGGMTDSAEDQGLDDSIICLVKDAPHGTVENVTVGTLGLRFVQVKITEGACKDKSGWVSAINLRE